MAVPASGPGTVLGTVADVFTEITGLIAAISTPARLAGTDPVFFDPAQGIASVSVVTVLVVAFLDALTNDPVAARGRLGQCQSQRDELFGDQFFALLGRCDKRPARETVGANKNGFTAHVFGQQDDQRLPVGFQPAGRIRDQPGFECLGPIENS